MLLWIPLQKWDDSQKDKPVLDFAKQIYPGLGRRCLDNKMEKFPGVQLKLQHVA